MRQRNCKIVATIGPASQSPSMLALLHQSGVDIFRLNFSHGDHKTHAEVIKHIRALEDISGTPIAIFADLQGPKIRCGDFRAKELELKFGESYRLVDLPETDEESTIPVPHKHLLDVLQIGDKILLDDGKLQLTIEGREDDAVFAKADTPGLLKSRKGINIPSRTLPVSALTQKDKEDLTFALDQGVDYIALSFVQRPLDVAEAREIIGDRARIIAKIEKPSAVDKIDEIIKLSDAIMVARGDLGVELPPERVPLIQRRLIQAAREAGKPVIVATHMLESMVEAPSPTRAEASDVSNAVMQGADAVMLSAESAIGRHPPTAVAIMDRIICAAEDDNEYWVRRGNDDLTQSQKTSDAVSKAAALLAQADDCKLVAAYTKTGSTAERISRERPRAAIFALTPELDVGRRLALFWGLHSIITEDVSHFMEMVQKAEDIAVKAGAVKDDERLVIVAGYPFGKPGSTNTLKVSRIGI